MTKTDNKRKTKTIPLFFYLWSHNHATQFYFIKLNELQVYIILSVATGFVEFNTTCIIIILVVRLEKNPFSFSVKLYFI